MSIFERVSVREFTDQKVEREKLIEVLRAAMQAPSAVNQQPWEFLVVDYNEEIFNKLYEQGGFARSMKTAQALLVLYYKNDVSHPQYVLEDMGACTQNALLRITELGLGGVWMGVAPVEKRIQMVNDLVGERENLTPFCLIAVGYPKEKRDQTSRFDRSRIHFFGEE